ncbi:MAG: hypothetical protein V1754_08190 [Pseudomonadota bacterium]
MLANPEIQLFAFAFPGIGTKFCGHESSFYLRHKQTIDPFLVEASEYAKADLFAPLLQGTKPTWVEELDHLFTYSFNCGVASAFAKCGFEPTVTAGYSLGLYSALFSSGAISFSGGLAITRTAYLMMKDDCTNKQFGMAAVVGLKQNEVENILTDPVLGSVQLVNSNNAASKIFAGYKSELEILLNHAQARGSFKAVLLDVAVPYHHPVFLKKTSQRFGSFLQTLKWMEPKYPVISSIDQTILQGKDELLTFTQHNISTPINWEAVVEKLTAIKIQTVLECGPGVLLSQNSRMIPLSPRFINIKNCQKRLGI